MIMYSFLRKNKKEQHYSNGVKCHTFTSQMQYEHNNVFLVPNLENEYFHLVTLQTLRTITACTCLCVQSKNYIIFVVKHLNRCTWPEVEYLLKFDFLFLLTNIGETGSFQTHQPYNTLVSLYDCVLKIHPNHTAKKRVKKEDSKTRELRSRLKGPCK